VGVNRFRGPRFQVLKKFPCIQDGWNARGSPMILRKNRCIAAGQSRTISARSAKGAIFPLFFRSFLFQNYQSGVRKFRWAQQTHEGIAREDSNSAGSKCHLRITSSLPTIRQEPQDSLPITPFLDTFRIADHPGVDRFVLLHGVTSGPNLAVELMRDECHSFDTFVGLDSAVGRNLRWQKQEWRC